MKPCYIDVHCHLDMCENIMEVVKRARKAEVGIIVTQGTGPESNRIALALGRTYPEVKVALGLYPLNAIKMSDDMINAELGFIKQHKDKIVAIGEVGIDFKEDDKEHERQKSIFSKIVRLALELSKPLIVHSRKAEQECIELLERSRAGRVIMHCFGGKQLLAKRIADNGWHLSMPASIKHSEHFQNIVRNISISQLLAETDSPYMHPDKKYPNEPAFVIESYKKIAEIKGMGDNEAKSALFDNYQKLFG